MSHSGIVKLLDKHGEILQLRSYGNRVIRNGVIEVWRLRYGHRFFNCMIQIEPELSSICKRTKGKILIDGKYIKRSYNERKNYKQYWTQHRLDTL